MSVFKLSALLAAAFLITPLTGRTQAPPGLQSLFEQAWQRSAAGRSQAARAGEAHAVDAQSRSWLANAPVLGVGQRTDRWNDGQGQRESEASLSATLYLPGQVNARRAFSNRNMEQVEAQRDKARLDLAGELRTRIWDAAAAEALLDEREVHFKRTDALLSEIMRRVHAGELARSDGLLAQQEVAAARVAAEEARSAARTALARLQQLTGNPVAPEAVAEQLASKEVSPDPRLAVAQAAERTAAAALRVADTARLPSPTLTLSTHRERESQLVSPQRSIGVAVQIPLGSAGRNQVAQSQALVQKAAAAAEAEQLALTLESERALAKARVQDANAALEAARQQAAAMREYSELIEKAFRLGERGLAELLRGHMLSHEAQVAARRQQVALGRAHAMYNQAAGVLP